MVLIELDDVTRNGQKRYSRKSQGKDKATTASPGLAKGRMILRYIPNSEQASFSLPQLGRRQGGHELLHQKDVITVQEWYDQDCIRIPDVQSVDHEDIHRIRVTWLGIIMVVSKSQKTRSLPGNSSLARHTPPWRQTVH